MLIRTEEQTDVEAVRRLNKSAFEGLAEAGLVDGLRKNAEPVISLVAEDNGEIVGHIMFSPVAHSMDADLSLMGLAPMAVSPDRQKEGIGSALIEDPRFGFLPSSKYGIASEYDVPEEVFLVIELQEGALYDKPGRVHYHREFSKI